MVLCSVTCQTEFTPLTYVYYSERRNWNDASQTCAQTDGMLARFPDVSTVMDILEELPAIKWGHPFCDDQTRCIYKVLFLIIGIDRPLFNVVSCSKCKIGKNFLNEIWNHKDLEIEIGWNTSIQSFSKFYLQM